MRGGETQIRSPVNNDVCVWGAGAQRSLTAREQTTNYSIMCVYLLCFGDLPPTPTPGKCLGARLFPASPLEVAHPHTCCAGGSRGCLHLSGSTPASSPQTPHFSWISI